MWQKNRYNFRDTKPAHAIKAIKMKDLVFFFGGGRVWGENQNEKYPNLTLMQGIIHVCYVPAHTCKYMQIKLQGKKDGKSKRYTRLRYKPATGSLWSRTLTF